MDKRACISILLGVVWYMSLGQERQIRVMGTVVDSTNAPVKNAMIFVDFLQTKAKTKKDGTYKLKVSAKSEVLSVYSPEYGILSTAYNGESQLKFKFFNRPEVMSEDQLVELGFTLRRKSDGNKVKYEDFSSVLEILDKTFYNVRVINGTIKIGRGANQFNGNTEPLILVDNQRVGVEVLGTIATTDIESIRVISNGSESAQYGSLKAANGVILITLKK